MLDCSTAWSQPGFTAACFDWPSASRAYGTAQNFANALALHPPARPWTQPKQCVGQAWSARLLDRMEPALFQVGALLDCPWSKWVHPWTEPVSAVRVAALTENGGHIDECTRPHGLVGGKSALALNSAHKHRLLRACYEVAHQSCRRLPTAHWPPSTM